jgi:predicted RNase H-like HicB family nuclease
MSRTFTAVVERDADTGFYVGFVPGLAGAHTQAESLDELHTNLKEVVAMLLEDGEPNIETEFVGTQLVEVGYVVKDIRVKPEEFLRVI